MVFNMLGLIAPCLIAWILVAPLTVAAPHGSPGTLTRRQATAIDKLVFSHFMVRFFEI